MRYLVEAGSVGCASMESCVETGMEAEIRTDVASCGIGRGRVRIIDGVSSADGASVEYSIASLSSAAGDSGSTVGVVEIFGKSAESVSVQVPA